MSHYGYTPSETKKINELLFFDKKNISYFKMVNEKLFQTLQEIISRDFYGTLTNLSVPVLLFHKIYKLTIIFMK